MNKLERIERMEADLAKLKAEVKAEAAIGDVPEVGQGYWWIASDTISGDIWQNDAIDQSRLEISNVFLTKEAAEKEVERRKVTAELKRMTKGFKPKWKDEEQRKWFLYYDHLAEQWAVGSCFTYQRLGDTILFATQEDAQTAINTLGERLDVLKDG